jgi:hypothetical protein
VQNVSEAVKVKVFDVIVERDPMTKIPKRVMAWELEIYRAKFPNGIEVIGEDVAEIDELPDAATESERMRSLHGADAKTNDVFFDDVYGKGRSGIAEFQRAIDESVVKHVKHAKPARAAKPEKSTQDSDAGKASDAAGDAGGEGAGAPGDPLADPA